jgi:hypothetical protein
LSFFSLDSFNAAASILLLWSVVSKVASAVINAPVFGLDSCSAAASIPLLWSVVSKVASAPINALVCCHFLVLILVAQQSLVIFLESVFFLYIVLDSFINFSFNQRVFLVFLRS